MEKWICSVCGHVHTGPNAEKCPVCGAGPEKFTKSSGEAIEFVDEHVVGVAKGCDAQVWQGLKENFEGECKEVGMYIAMSRQAHREGYPEIGEAFLRYALEEAEHAAKFAELMGEVLTNDTKTNVLMRFEAEAGANAGKKQIATRAKELGYDAIHDTVHEMAKDEARHGRGFKGLYDRYFAK